MKRFESERLLVVVAHQDDESVIAAGALQQVVAGGGRAEVIFTTDGGAAAVPSSPERNRIVAARNAEALRALALAGVTPDSVHFLAQESGPHFITEGCARGVLADIVARIATFRPDIIVTTAFEGGHLEHDITNFLVAHATASSGIRVLEAPLYNRYYFREPICWRLQRVFKRGFEWPPSFPPGKGSGKTLPMTAEQLTTKRQMLECFGTQRHLRLTERFTFPDRFRPLPVHDYLAGPFDPVRSPRHAFNRLVHGRRAYPFDRPGFGVPEYRDLFQRLAAGLRGTEMPLAHRL